jgi:F-type H+-transporting ATPase subunit c
MITKPQFGKENVMKIRAFMYSLVGLFASTAAFAEEGAQAVAATSNNSNLLGLGLGLGFGIAAMGGAFGQGKAAAAALEGITRNPQSAEKAFTPMILGLVFIESLVLFVFALAFLKL